MLFHDAICSFLDISDLQFKDILLLVCRKEHIVVDPSEHLHAFYAECFGDSYIAKVTDFYVLQSNEWIRDNLDTNDYLIKTEEALKLESQLAKALLFKPDLEGKLLSCLQNVLLFGQQNALLDNDHSGMPRMLITSNEEALRRAYHLFSQSSTAVVLMKKILKNFLFNAFEICVMKKQSPAVTEFNLKCYIDDLHQFFKKHRSILLDVVEYQTTFEETFTVLFHQKSDILNGNSSNTTFATAPKLLASYCDVLMKNSMKKIFQIDSDFEIELEKILTLLHFLNDKDIFEEIHRKRMCNRLLLSLSNNSNHFEAELTFVSKLKSKKFDPSFTSKLEKMLNDCVVSNELQEDFKNHTQVGFGFSVKVLTAAFWPTIFDASLFRCYPLQVKERMEEFEKKYVCRFSNRILTWVQSVTKVTLTANFETDTKELEMSAFQASILLQFNSKPSQTTSDLRNRLELPTDFCINLFLQNMKSISSIECFQILRREKYLPSQENMSKDCSDETEELINDNDIFHFNVNFSNRKKKISLPSMLLTNSKNAMKIDEEEQVHNVRKYQIQACIVRIMKAAKVMEYTILVSSIISELRRIFHPDIKMIKLQIEDLIDRQYLERDPNRTTLIKYLA